MPGSTCSTTSPPSPPSPPFGPPRGTYFSRRKLMQPSPPSPASTRTRTSSTNFMIAAMVAQGAARPQRRSRAEPGGTGSRRARRSGLRFRGGLDPHPRAVPAPALVLDGAVDEREQRPIAADADVRPGVHARAHLAHEDVAGAGVLAREHLDAPALPLAVAAVAAAALSLLVRHQQDSYAISVTRTAVMLCRCPRRRR